MTCNECESAHQSGDVYPYRIGAEGIGWGTILISGCKTHATMAIDLLNDSQKILEQIQAKFGKDLDLLTEKVKKMKEGLDDLDRRMNLSKELDDKTKIGLHKTEDGPQ